VEAKRAAYVGGGPSAVPSRLGAHDLVYSREGWSYRDSYFGGTDFLGQEVVWRDGLAVWALNYYGRVLRADVIDGERAGRVIKAALSALYCEGRFLGGSEMDVDGFVYIDTNTGSIESFTGVERITQGGVVCYRLDYAGGLVRA
jgi:hypothetical protein